LSFMVDTKLPNVSISIPLDNSWDNDGQVTMSYYPTDIALHKCELWGNFSGSWEVNQTDTSPTNGTTNNFDTITISDGTYIWNVNCTDYAGNQNWSNSNYTIFIDTTKPMVAYTSPTPPNNTNQSSSTMQINVTHSETNADTLLFYVNGGINDSRSYPSDYSNHTLTGLADGLYTYSVWVNDSAGNQNQTGTNIIRIDSTPPAVFLESPANDTWRNIETATVTFSYNVSDALLSISDCSLILNHTINLTNTTVEQDTSQYFIQTFDELAMDGASTALTR